MRIQNLDLEVSARSSLVSLELLFGNLGVARN